MYSYTSDPTTSAVTCDVKERDTAWGFSGTHQISYTNNGGSAGTLTIEVKPLGTDRFEDLTIDGVQVEIPMDADSTFGPFDGYFAEIKATPAGFNGTSFTVTFAGA